MSDHTIGMFQVWVHDRRREAQTDEERLGWIRLDAWITQRVAVLKEQYSHQNIDSLPMFRLVDKRTDT
jgi:hypothetical protein